MLLIWIFLPVVSAQERLEFVAVRGMAEPFQRLLPHLANPLPRHAEDLSDLLERLGAIPVQAVVELEDLRLPVRQRGEGIVDRLGEDALPQIFLGADSPERAFVEKTSGAILVLLAFLILMNAAAIVLRQKFERRW